MVPLNSIVYRFMRNNLSYGLLSNVDLSSGIFRKKLNLQSLTNDAYQMSQVIADVSEVKYMYLEIGAR